MHLNRPYVMNTVAGIVCRRVVDCGASACAHFLDLVASVPFVSDPFVFVHSILFRVVGVEIDIVVVPLLLFHCNILLVRASVIWIKLEKAFQFYSQDNERS